MSKKAYNMHLNTNLCTQGVFKLRCRVVCFNLESFWRYWRKRISQLVKSIQPLNIYFLNSTVELLTSLTSKKGVAIIDPIQLKVTYLAQICLKFNLQIIQFHLLFGNNSYGTSIVYTVPRDLPSIIHIGLYHARHPFLGALPVLHIQLVLYLFCVCLCVSIII